MITDQIAAIRNAIDAVFAAQQATIAKLEAENERLRKPKPEPQPAPVPPSVTKLHATGDSDRVLLRIRDDGYTLGPVEITSDRPSAGTATGTTAFDIDAADVTLRNVVVGNENFRYVLLLGPKTRNLRVHGLTAKGKIEGDWLYDNGNGQARDIIIDLAGGTLPGSTEENGFRIHATDVTLRNGTIKHYDTTYKGVKAWATIQSGSRNVLMENLDVEGGFGAGPIITSSGWQTEPTHDVTLRKVHNAKGRQIRINSGCYGTVLEDVTWHQFDARSVIEGYTRNPTFNGEKPIVTLRGTCTFTGGTKLTNGNVKLVIEPGAVVTYNGKAVTP